MAVALIAAVWSLVPSGGNGGPRVEAQPAERWELVEVREPSFDPGALLDPAGVSAGPDATFAVVDRGHHRIAWVDASGVVARAFGRRGHGDGELNAPRDVAVDAARDRVYVADRGNRRLAIFTLDGTWRGAWMQAGPEYLLVPHAVAVAPGGDVYVLSNSSIWRVERFAPDGRWLGGWGEVGIGAGEFSAPAELTVHPDGRVLVADPGNRSLMAFSAEGLPESAVDLAGVRDATVEPASGRILAVHNGDTGDRDEVSIFTSALVLEQTVSSNALPAGERFRPAEHIAAGAGGRVALSTGPGGEAGRQGLRQYRSDWTQASATLADPLAFTGFLEPVAIETAGDGSLVLIDRRLGVARRYGPDGSFDRTIPNGAGDELALTPDGVPYVLSTGGRVGVRRVGGPGPAWNIECACFSGPGIAVTADRLYATAAVSQTLFAYDPANTDPDAPPVASITVPDPPYAWPLDVTVDGSGRVLAAGGEGRAVDLFDAAGTTVGGWAGSEGAQRITAGPDGTVFTLDLDGSIDAWNSQGSLRATWRPQPVDGYDAMMPGDIAAGPGGRLYVVDEISRAILVFEPRGNAPTPTPSPTPDPPCSVTGDKTADPAVVQLGQAVDIELTFDITCRPDRELRSDIMLVIDRSNSMANLKLNSAKAAAEAFVSAPELSLGRNRVGLVSFSDVVSLDQPLTGELDAIRDAIRAVHHAGNTDLAGALHRASVHVASEGRADALPVVLMLTDGQPNRDGQPFVDAWVAAAKMRARGALVYMIGLGDSTDVALLEAMAGSPARYFEAPRPEQLETIYDALSRSVGGVVATDVEVDDELGPDVELVPGSPRPIPVVEGRTLRWELDTLPAGGTTLSLQVRPRVLGTVATNVRAVAQYVADGNAYEFEFPVPEIEVVAAATQTATPTPSPTPSPTATSTGPDQIYLPVAMRNVCQQEDARLGVDIVLVLDTSSSMAGPKIDLAQEASRQFVDLVDPRRDRVGVVTFNQTARRVAAITANLEVVRQRLQGLPTAPGTRMDLGLDKALEEISFRAREGSRSVIIVLSDGYPTPEARDATLRAAAAAAAREIVVFAIGLGTEVDDPFMRRIAGQDQRYYAAPTAQDLAEIYRLIAGNLPCR